MQDKKTILIVGAGFAGFNAAVKLSAALTKKQKEQFEIAIIDRNDYHLYHPNLYELATSEEDFSTIEQMKHSVAVPMKKYLPADINCISGEISAIDHKAKKIKLANGKEINFEYLVLSLGSKTDCFNIKGLEENSIGLKNIQDALRIRSMAESLVEKHRMDMNKPLIRFVIGGGGFTGVELAGEMANLIEILSWKYDYPLEKLEIVIVEGMSHLLNGLAEKVSHMVYERLKDLAVRVHIHTGNFISEATDKHIVINNGEVMNYDMLIWTGGVRSVELPFTDKTSLQIDNKSRVAVDAKLMVKGAANIFALGDNAMVLGKDGRPLPQTATQAISQADYVAAAIAALVSNEEVKNFEPIESSYIIPVCGKWAVLHLANGFTMYGFWPWIIRQFADLRYFMRLMPFWQAVKLVWFDTEMYIRND